MDLILCSLEPWDEVWRRNQFLVHGLLRDEHVDRVLFVEPVCDPLHQLRGRNQARRGDGLSEVSGYQGRLHRLELTKWLPRLAGPWADRQLHRALDTAVRQLTLESPLLWINDPGWAHLMVHSGWPAIYDITDDWAAADRTRREHHRILANENLLMQACRSVVVCSPGLAQSKGQIRDVELIPNAVDAARYQQPGPRPEDLGEGGTALYVGTLHEDRLDVPLCLRLGERLAAQGAELVLLGPNALSAEHTEVLMRSPGVQLLGARPHHQIPAYLCHADLLVVPHAVNDFTNSLDPLKLYEYQAASRPIAATPVAGFRELRGTPGVAIHVADELVTAAADLLTHPPKQVGPFAPADWSARVTAMAAVIQRAAAGA